MTDEEFMSLMDDLGEYLKANKVFIQDPVRFAEVQRATEIARQLFPETEIVIEDDPIQMGALILSISDFDVAIRGETEINLFTEMISKANNVEIYQIGNERVHIAVVFSHVLTRLSQGNLQ